MGPNNDHRRPLYASSPSNRPLARYVKLPVAHAPGMPGTFSLPPRVSDPDMHHGTCMTHAAWCMPGSLTSGFLWSRSRGKRSRYSRCMGNRNFTYLVRSPWLSTLYLIITFNDGCRFEMPYCTWRCENPFVYNWHRWSWNRRRCQWSWNSELPRSPIPKKHTYGVKSCDKLFHITAPLVRQIP